MSVHEEYLEKSLSNVNAQVDGDERDRMWQRTSDVLDSSSVSSYKSQDILPLRPGISKHNKKKTTRVSALISTQHKERGLHRPDEWVGELRKKNRKSWKAKAVRDVNLDDSDHHSVQSVPADFGRREEPLLFSKPDSKQDEKTVVPAVVLSQKPEALNSSSAHTLLTEDSRWSQISEDDWIQGGKEMNDSTSSLFGGTAMLVASKDTTTNKKDLDGSAISLLSDSSNHSSATRDHMRKWQSMSAVNSNFSFLDLSPEKPKIRPKWKPTPARTLPTTEVQKEKESTPAPTKSAAAKPLTTTQDDMHCLPDLEMSLSSLDTTLSSIHENDSSKTSPSSLDMSLSSIHENDSKKMWKSMGNMDYRPKMKRASDPLPSAKHRFRAHNRPDDWLGPGSKPARKSWTAKTIVEPEDIESTTPEYDEVEKLQAEQAPTEVAEAFSKGVGAPSNKLLQPDPEWLLANLKVSSHPDDLVELKVKVVDIGNREDLLPVSPKSSKEEDQDTAEWTSTQLKASSRGDLMKEQGNLAYPTKSHAANSHSRISVTLRPTPNGSKVKQGEDIH
jgi:hypothetical protein